MLVYQRVYHGGNFSIRIEGFRLPKGPQEIAFCLSSTWVEEGKDRRIDGFLLGAGWLSPRVFDTNMIY